MYRDSDHKNILQVCFHLYIKKQPINYKDALKSFGMYRYNKDEMIRDRNTNYKGKLIEFRMKEEKRNEMYSGW